MFTWKAEGHRLGMRCSVVEGPLKCEVYGFYPSTACIHTPLHEAWLSPVGRDGQIPLSQVEG